MKYFSFLILIFVFLTSCEEDDICFDEKSPQLFIKFENQLPENENRMDSVIIYRKEPNGNFELILAQPRNNPVDSVKVSLRIDEVNQTQLILTPRRFDTNLYDTLTINYDRKIVFGSKACGYKVNYIQTEYQISQNYFVDKEEIELNIIHEENPHLLLYY